MSQRDASITTNGRSGSAASTLEPMLVRLPVDLREQVRAAALTEDRTQAQVVRRALREYLAAHHPESPNTCAISTSIAGDIDVSPAPLTTAGGLAAPGGDT